MAVYKRAYRPYAGALTPAWSRFLIIPRYAFEKIFRSKILTSYFVLCFFPALVGGILIYLYNNPLVRLAIGMRGEAGDMPFGIDGRFFYYILRTQGTMAFLLTAWLGPTLVAPDLANNALTLYLSRPFSRFEYVIGKLSVLFLLLSAVTWVPDLILFFLHGGLAGGGWITSHLDIAWAILAGSWIWIAVQSLLALAVSAWLKWRIAASGLMVGIFFVAAGFGEAFNGILRTYWGHLFNLGYLLTVIWYDLFDVPLVRRMPRGVAENFGWNRDIPVGIAWMALVTLSLFCVLLLNRRLRAKEVVRG